MVKLGHDGPFLQLMTDLITTDEMINNSGADINSVIHFILKYVELLLNVAQIVCLYLLSKSNLIEYGY